MKLVLVLHLDHDNSDSDINFLGQHVRLLRRGCRGELTAAQGLIEQFDGQVDAIGLEGMPAQLHLGPVTTLHATGSLLAGAARRSPMVDGDGVRAGLERWGVILGDRAQPGIFSQKRVLMIPGLNHGGLVQALSQRGASLRYADPHIYFGLPRFPGMGAYNTLEQAAPATLERLNDWPFRRLFPRPGRPGHKRADEPFVWADILAGDVGAIRRYAPADLKHKTVIVESASQADLEDLATRGAAILVTMMPSLDSSDDLGRWSAATVEAVLVALRPDPASPMSEDTYLDLLADIEWSPGVRYLQPEEASVNRFAFVIHPLDVGFIHGHPLFRWTKILPDAIVEEVSAYIPPIYLAKIRGGVSKATGQRIEGHLISLGATPRQMMKRDEHFTYKRLNTAARMAERLGARIMGLGAFTSVVGDAGVTVAHEADIAITSGNSLTVAATLEAAKQAVVRMGATDLTKGKVMIVGATGSIASVCARLLAQAIFDVVLVSIEPEKLIELKRTIQSETPGAQVTIATRTGDLISECDLVVTATSAFGQRVIDVTRCKPGAVICDVARPPDISPAEAALRPDVLVIESGEVLIPGDVEFGYDIGLPPKTAYACLGETALLAMDGLFEDFTVGRNIEMERVKEIFRLFKYHGFQLADLRSFGEYITDEEFARKRDLAMALRADPELLARTKAQGAEKLKDIPVSAKGVARSDGNTKKWIGLAAGAGLLAVLVGRRMRQT